MDTTTSTTSSEALWTLADVASYYRRSLRQARRIVSADGFPPAVRGDGRRWVAAQVRAWAEGAWQPETPAASTVLRPGVAAGSRVVRRRAA